jgi:hypothetical protein
MNRLPWLCLYHITSSLQLLGKVWKEGAGRVRAAIYFNKGPGQVFLA